MRTAHTRQQDPPCALKDTSPRFPGSGRMRILAANTGSVAVHPNRNREASPIPGSLREFWPSVMTAEKGGMLQRDSKENMPVPDPAGQHQLRT